MSIKPELTLRLTQGSLSYEDHFVPDETQSLAEQADALEQWLIDQGAITRRLINRQPVPLPEEKLPILPIPGLNEPERALEPIVASGPGPTQILTPVPESKKTSSEPTMYPAKLDTEKAVDELVVVANHDAELASEAEDAVHDGEPSKIAPNAKLEAGEMPVTLDDSISEPKGSIGDLLAAKIATDTGSEQPSVDKTSDAVNQIEHLSAAQRAAKTRGMSTAIDFPADKNDDITTIADNLAEDDGIVSDKSTGTETTVSDPFAGDHLSAGEDNIFDDDFDTDADPFV